MPPCPMIRSWREPPWCRIAGGRYAALFLAGSGARPAMAWWCCPERARRPPALSPRGRARRLRRPVDRAFWPIGDASIWTTCRMPPRSRRRTCPGSGDALSSARAAGMRLSRTRAVFPAPDGPASAVSRRAGKVAARSCRSYRSLISMAICPPRPSRAGRAARPRHLRETGCKPSRPVQARRQPCERSSPDHGDSPWPVRTLAGCREGKRRQRQAADGGSNNFPADRPG